MPCNRTWQYNKSILLQSHLLGTCFSIHRSPVSSVTKINKPSFVANSMVPARLVARALALALLTILLVCCGGHSLKCFRQLSPCACEVTADNSSVLDFSPLDAGGGVRVAFQAQDEHVPPRRWLFLNFKTLRYSYTCRIKYYLLSNGHTRTVCTYCTRQRKGLLFLFIKIL